MLERGGVKATFCLHSSEDLEQHPTKVKVAGSNPAGDLFYKLNGDNLNV